MSVGVVNKQTGDRIPTAGMPAIDNALDLTSANPVQNAIVTAALANKQDTLTFDDVPTDNSNNPVKSNGIYDALALKQDATDSNLQTTADTIVGAINEHEGDIDSLKSGLTNYQIQNDINLEVPNRKNVLPLTIDNVKKYTDYAVWSGNSVTIKGVTYTFDVNDNGSVTKIHAEGTATDGDAWLTLYRKNTDFGNCILSGCPSSGSVESYILSAYKSNPSVWYYDRGTGVSIPNNVTIEQVYINIANGYAIPSGGIDFYPMIRPATITDPTFAPYIPSVESRIEAVESDVTGLIENVTFEPYQAPGSDPFAEDGSGYLLKVTYQSTLLGYLVIRPRGYANPAGRKVAIELFDSGWRGVWEVHRDYPE